MKFSRAAEVMLKRLAHRDSIGELLPFNDVDYRVYPKLMSDQLVASTIYRPGGVCLTPIGRKLAKEKGFV